MGFQESTARKDNLIHGAWEETGLTWRGYRGTGHSTCSFVSPVAHTAYFVMHLPPFPESPTWTGAGLCTPGKKLTSGHRRSKTKE